MCCRSQEAKGVTAVFLSSASRDRHQLVKAVEQRRTMGRVKAQGLMMRR